MKELLERQYYLKPGKVLVKFKIKDDEKEKGRWQSWKQVNQYAELVAVSKNISNFKDDFPAKVGDKVFCTNYSSTGEFRIDDTVYRIIDAGQVLMVFK